MLKYDLALFAVYLALLLALTPPLGRFMARVYGGEKNLLTSIVGRIEHLIYRACAVDAKPPPNGRLGLALGQRCCVSNLDEGVHAGRVLTTGGE